MYFNIFVYFSNIGHTIFLGLLDDLSNIFLVIELLFKRDNYFY